MPPAANTSKLFNPSQLRTFSYPAHKHSCHWTVLTPEKTSRAGGRALEAQRESLERHG